MKPMLMKVSGTGRLTLPAEVRRALGLQCPGQMVLRVEDGQLRLLTTRQVHEEVRALARPYRPVGELASEQLIRERRGEAPREGEGS
jgi:bifunctional DNA-binding transcriptional regulator/antitoxin component of YhaV-PrlF toxin-antitoxin module